MSENILRVNGQNFRMTDSGEIEQWNHIQKKYGKPFKNADLDAVRAAFAATSTGGAVPESVEIVPDPALEPAPELSEEEQEALEEATALEAKLAEAREALKAAKEKAKLAKARRIARDSGTTTGTIGERVYRDPVKVALVAALAIPEGETSVSVTYTDLVSALPVEITEKATPYEIAKLIRTQLGQLTSVALAGSKVLNLSYEKESITAYPVSDEQKAELAFFDALLRAEKARSPKKSKLENVGTVGTDEPDDEGGDEDSEEIDEAA